MRGSKWFLMFATAMLMIEFVLPPLLGGRSVGFTVLERIPLTDGLVGEARAIGIAVSDADAAVMSGAATVEPECGGWDVDSGGCHWICWIDNCPDTFDIFDSDDCLYCDYTASKQNGTRECSAGGFDNACTNVIDSILGCVVKG